MGKNTFQRFRRVDPFVTLLWIVLTAGLYVPYWLYTRTRLLNELCPKKPIPIFFVGLCIALLIIYVMLLLDLMGFANGLLSQYPQPMKFQEIMANEPLMKQLATSNQYQSFQKVAMAFSFIQIIWAVIFCQRLNFISQSAMGNPLYCSYFILLLSVFFIMNVFYLQYKINQYIASNVQTPEPENDTLGLM